MKKIWLLLIVIALGGCKMSSDTNEEEVSDTSGYMYDTIINDTDKDLIVKHYPYENTTLAPGESKTFATNLSNKWESLAGIYFKSPYGYWGFAQPLIKKANTKCTTHVTVESFDDCKE